MITQADIRKLKQVFVTKEDLKKELSVVVREITNVITTLGEGIQESLDKLKNHDSILENHERRLDKLEDKVLSTN